MPEQFEGGELSKTDIINYKNLKSSTLIKLKDDIKFDIKSKTNLQVPSLYYFIFGCIFCPIKYKKLMKIHNKANE